ncbi:MAG: ribonuclease HII [Candidatus Moranbacteria bacterium RIFCSPHIGHO2_02_FULL_40_12b]|nr:MAG: ribonuclease HII [Candidatus Moranbacteria bacterium RIFCSPHIGHO2_02_FULL_40_12b]OGI24326.1 MAG: ribonuclease HII [Candidatus Moranbacteria bacterium RIFCSPHIGHO2_12_FULL_40_10]
MRKSNPSNFNLEKKLLSSGYDFVIGIDEAGRGPLAGPVVASAVAYKFFNTAPACGHPSLIKEGMGEVLAKEFNLIRDSKMLSEKQREKIFDFILENFYVGVGICDHKTIDRINILEASFLAMKAALTSLKSKIKNQNAKLQFKNQNDLSNTKYQIPDTRYIILVDGNKVIPNLSIEQRAIVNGDKIVKSISAASIIAKVTRDRLMREMHKKYPNYCFDRHKGYGTRQHFAMLRKHGPCEIHRRSFAPVKKLAKKGI